MWNNAELLIRHQIGQMQHLNLRNQFRHVIEVPPYRCFRNAFNGAEGFKIQVGAKSFVEIPICLLQEVFEYARVYNNGIYNKNVIRYLYPSLYQQKPCIVHTIGKIFELSGIAIQINRTDYQL